MPVQTRSAFVRTLVSEGVAAAIGLDDPNLDSIECQEFARPLRDLRFVYQFMVGHRTLAPGGKSSSGEKNADCLQFAPRHGPRNNRLSLKRPGWLYPIFREVYSYHGLLPAGDIEELRRVLTHDLSLDFFRHRIVEDPGWVIEVVMRPVGGVNDVLEITNELEEL